jgi:hypothetical protein
MIREHSRIYCLHNRSLGVRSHSPSTKSGRKGGFTNTRDMSPHSLPVLVISRPHVREGSFLMPFWKWAVPRGVIVITGLCDGGDGGPRDFLPI